MKILFLSAWYPHRKDDMEGLFVRKHAQAAARFDQVHVLAVKAEKDLVLPEGSRFEYAEQLIGGVHEHYAYYPQGKKNWSKFYRFLRTYYRAYARFCRENGRPDLIHVNVLTRHALIARLLQIRFGIPYVVSEHWSRYYRKEFRGPLHRFLTRYAARHARRVMPVSESLARAMRDCGLKARYTVVRNVVDDFFFRNDSEESLPAPSAATGASTAMTETEPAFADGRHRNEPEKNPNKVPGKTILHVCCFDEAAKNNFGLLRALKTLSLVRDDFRMVFVGTGTDFEKTVDYARLLHFPARRVVFTGKLQPSQVKDQILRSDFMVLFSNYETASVVLCENLACGKPAVATRTGGIPEIIRSENGILVEPGNEHQLWKALDTMLDHYRDYDPASIRHEASEFSFDRIGQTFSRIYRESLKPQKRETGKKKKTKIK